MRLFARGVRSLTRNLFTRITLVILLGVIMIAVIAESAVSSVMNRNFDDQLRIGANLLVNLMYDELQDISRHPAQTQEPLLSFEDRQAFDSFARWRMFRIWYGGELRLASPSGPPPILPRPGQLGRFTVIRDHGEEWRVYAVAAAGGNPVVEVGERLRVRHDLIGRIALELAAPFIVVALLLLLVLWFSIRTGLKDLAAFSLALSHQKDRPPFYPLTAAEWPLELEQLVGVINGLFARIELSLNRERAFIDMAAHQLRTPLGGLSIEAQLCARTEDPQELAERLERLNTSTRRVAQLVDQLLTLAQIEAAPRGGDGLIAIKSVLSPVIADIAPQAARRGVEIAVDGDDIEVRASEMALQLLLSNLIGNAVKYSPDGAEVVIRLAGDARAATIDITDHGPGMSDADKAQAFDRFWQAPTAAAGSGLGLAIAREAADAVGAQLELTDRDDGQNGLAARVTLRSN